MRTWQTGSGEGRQSSRAPDEASAEGLAEVARKRGYAVRTYASPKCALPWTCQCSVRMLATHGGVIAVQDELADLARPFGGRSDGWGTFGNRAGAGPAAG